MSKLTRKTIPWNSGAMLGWNRGRRMNRIMDPPNNAQVQIMHEPDEAEYKEIKKSGPNNRHIVSSFFPYSGDGGNRAAERDGASTRAIQQPHCSRRPIYEPQKDFSPEFLEYLHNLSNRDFEHADDAQNNNLKQNQASIDRIYSNGINSSDPNTCKSKLRDSQQKLNCIHGYQIFGTPSSPSRGALNWRPSTVPRYLSRKEAGKNNEINPRSIVKPAGQLEAEGTSKEKPLTRTRVTPSEVDNAVDSQENMENVRKVDSSNLEQSKICEQASFSTSFTTPRDDDSERPSSSASSSGSKRVTFAADVVNYERENKPAKKRKFPRRRRQGFPHPSRGIFVPPDLEIVESTGPAGICRDNPYLNFNQVWTHPAARSTGESVASRVVRQERFHRIMNELEHAHIQYNRLLSIEQNDYLIHSIFKRYILVLDLALVEGHLTQVEHLLDTIAKSIPVLQQNTFYFIYGPKLIAKEENQSKTDELGEEHPDLMLINYALSRISGSQPRQETANMSIETVLVKLCLELIELTYSKYGSYEFRSALNTLPFTAKQAIKLLKDLRASKDSFCYIKWVNNSAVQRDYRSIMKSLGLSDRFGCKADILPSTTHNTHGKVEMAASKIRLRQASGHRITRRSRPLPKNPPDMTQSKPFSKN